MEYIITKRNKKKLIYKNFLHYEQKKVKLGIWWVCVNKALCNGTVTTDEEITTVFKFGAHNHESDTDFINAERAKCTMKNTAKKNYDLPSRIYARNVVNLSDESKRFIGNENSIKGVCGVFAAISIQKFQK